MTGYIPQRPSSLTAVPTHVRNILIAHLKSRLGDDFYRRLQFEGGEIIDTDEWHRVQPQTKTYPWSPPTYNLHFRLPLADKGVESFCAQIELDATGKILTDLTLPRVSADPSKAGIVSRAAAEIEAKRVGVPVESAFVELGYSPDLDAMVWVFYHASKSEGARFWGNTCYINAHTGRFIRWSYYEGVA